MTLTAGTRIGPYEILDALGAGGMGEVYRARDTRLDRIVAIKSLPQELAHDPSLRARMEREAKLLASVNHPNIGSIYGLEESDGLPYLVLEFVPGETLAERLRRGPLTITEAVGVAIQIASAVETAHERGVVHRDLKPGNVMLTSSGAVKVLDFGIATGRRSSSPGDPIDATRFIAGTRQGTVLGTAAYMSPEQMRAQTVDRRADIWSLGCIVYECLSGRRAFSGATDSDLIANVLDREPDWTAIPASTPKPLQDLIRRCLKKIAAERPGDIGSLRRDLVAIAETSKLSESHAPAVAGAVMPSLAVLYFENLSSDPESDYFCAGITEDILTDLSKLKGMRVASRNAVARYRGAPADIPKIASELGVTAVMEGSVRRAGNRVRITAQLINPADGFHLWAERYDRTLQDVFAVQEEIASSIATALRGTLTPSESKSLRRDRPQDARAYDLYLKGRERYSQYTVETIRDALGLFKQASEIDPSYALAWAGIGDSYGQLMQLSLKVGIDEELGTLGLEAARRAIALDPGLPEGHKAEALVLRHVNARDASMAALRRAIEVDPKFKPALINLGIQILELSDFAQAERLIRRATAIDQADDFAATWLWTLLYFTGRWDEALDLASAVLKRHPSPYYSRLAAGVHVTVHLRRRDFAAARATLSEAQKRESGSADTEYYRALAGAIAFHSGDLEEARRILPLLEGYRELSLITLLWGAEISLGLGDHEGSLRFLARRAAGYLAETLVRVLPELRPLVGEPPFVPKRLPNVLIWPREAPPPGPEVAELFAGVRLESGLPG